MYHQKNFKKIVKAPSANITPIGKSIRHLKAPSASLLRHKIKPNLLIFSAQAASSPCR